jgi:hypothetical protein
MNPALIGVALILLLVVANVAAGEEEDLRRERAEKDEPVTRGWSRQLGAMAGALIVLPLGVIFGVGPEILFLDAPAWWWAWIAAAVGYVVVLLLRVPD